MNSTLLTTTPAPAPFTFPGIFRAKESGSLWFAGNPHDALRIVIGPNRLPHYSYELGTHLRKTNAFNGAINPAQHEQVTGDITIKFSL